MYVRNNRISLTQARSFLACKRDGEESINQSVVKGEVTSVLCISVLSLQSVPTNKTVDSLSVSQAHCTAHSFTLPIHKRTNTMHTWLATLWYIRCNCNFFSVTPFNCCAPNLLRPRHVPKRKSGLRFIMICNPTPTWPLLWLLVVSVFLILTLKVLRSSQIMYWWLILTFCSGKFSTLL